MWFYKNGIKFFPTNRRLAWHILLHKRPFQRSLAPSSVPASLTSLRAFTLSTWTLSGRPNATVRWQAGTTCSATTTLPWRKRTCSVSLMKGKSLVAIRQPPSSSWPWASSPRRTRWNSVSYQATASLLKTNPSSGKRRGVPKPSWLYRSHLHLNWDTYNTPLLTEAAFYLQNIIIVWLYWR